MAAVKRVRVLVSGRVQGVFYRAATRDAAVRLGLAGWVRNLPDGRVEATFEGRDGQVELVIAWCRQGPSHARVDDLTVIEETAADPLTGFEVRG